MIWLGASAGAVGVTQYYIGYLLKAGHIAVVTHLVKTGSLPENQFAYGKEVVKEKFATAAAYFAVDRLVSGAVRQINGTLNIVGSFSGKNSWNGVSGFLCQDLHQYFAWKSG